MHSILNASAGTMSARAAEAPRDGHVWIVSNRLPVTADESGGTLELVPSTGGLASGMRAVFEASSATWIGWPGPLSASCASQRRLADALAQQHMKPVALDQKEIEGYYDGFSNTVIWPLFHYLLDRIPMHGQHWEMYQRVNQRFADSVLEEYQPGDIVWVHDYHLMLVPGLVRERCPEARIGFFLHIPFPAPEVFRTLPWRQELLAGLLGADLVGFHTMAYVKHFAEAVQAQFRIENEHDRVRFEGRDVRLGHFPMCPDVAQFERLANDAAVQEEAARIREDSRGRFLFLGVDRLDYTKGIPRRLLAFERLLERNPDLRDSVRLIQLAVPSRGGVEAYGSFRTQVEELVGRINGAVGTLDSVPIHYLHRAVTPEQLTAMYCAADALLVTPLRDGMNLVAKEFVAARADEDGVLVLSEFAGAAEELGEALIVNPYDVDGLADVMERAMTMERAERVTRMRALRRRVLGRRANDWAQRFIAATLEAAAARGQGDALTAPYELEGLLKRFGAATRVVFVLDYDGTLVGLREMPELATPDASLLRLLATLVATGSDVHIASGRPREELERWFSALPISLWAEHGLWHRASPESAWEPRAQVSAEWIPEVRVLLDRYMVCAPGSHVEEKSASIAWHYRLVEPGLGTQRAAELRRALETALVGRPLEILEGHRVLEVRSTAVDKGSVIREIVQRAPAGSLLVAIGDDRTDEDMFAALPPDGVAIRVGAGRSTAAYRLATPFDVRSLLGALA